MTHRPVGVRARRRLLLMRCKELQLALWTLGGSLSTVPCSGVWLKQMLSRRHLSPCRSCAREFMAVDGFRAQSSLLLTVIARASRRACLSVRPLKKKQLVWEDVCLCSPKCSFLRRSPGVRRTTRCHSPDLASIVLPLRIADSRADEIAVISHELRNSLGVVRNAARLLRFPSVKMALMERACSSNVMSAR